MPWNLPRNRTVLFVIEKSNKHAKVGYYKSLRTSSAFAKREWFSGRKDVPKRSANTKEMEEEERRSREETQ